LCLDWVHVLLFLRVVSSTCGGVVELSMLLLSRRLFKSKAMLLFAMLDGRVAGVELERDGLKVLNRDVLLFLTASKAFRTRPVVDIELDLIFVGVDLDLFSFVRLVVGVVFLRAIFLFIGIWPSEKLPSLNLLSSRLLLMANYGQKSILQKRGKAQTAVDG